MLTLKDGTRKHVYVYQPQGFDPKTLLPPSRRPQADELLWMVGTVINKTISITADHDARAPKDDFARLSSSILRKYIHHDHIAPLWKALMEHGVIETRPHRAGVRCRGYRLTDEWADRPIERHSIHDPFLVSRVQKRREWFKREQAERWLPIHGQLEAIQMECLGVNSVVMSAALDALPIRVRRCQQVLVDRINERRCRFHVCSTHRVSNGLTGVKRDLRQGTTIEGQPVGSIDMKSAQPRFLAWMLPNLCNSHPLKSPISPIVWKHKGLGWDGVLPSLPLTVSLPSSTMPSLDRDEVRRFVDLVCGCEGDFYNVLAGWWDYARPGFNVDRPLAKILFMQEWIAKRPGYRSSYRDRVASVFPTIDRFVSWFNQRSHGNLVRYLQRLEAWFVIERVGPLLVDHLPVVTLHDCLYGPIGSLSTIEAAFQQVADELRFPFPTERQDCSPCPGKPSPPTTF